MSSFWISVLEQGLIFAIMAQGVYITYKILDFPDLSVDGTFPLGAAITSALLLKGVNPYLATLAALFFGMFGGLATGVLHVKLKITNLLSGILVMIGLYSINLRIMSKPNIPLFNQSIIFNNSVPKVLIILAVALIVKLTLDIFLKTKLGFLLKATGDNHQLVTSLGVDIDSMKILGLMLSNGIVALSGSILAQHQGFADIGMGGGMIVTGLASIILGEALLKHFNFITGTTLAIIGAMVYKAIIALALKLGLPPTDLKLISSVIVIVILALYQANPKKSLKPLVKKGGSQVVTNTKSIQDI
ncbi:ABC transporter permease [Clostridium sp. BSD9I1]|uniref:ABC transporter permease n=1 Tax=Clostridium sp. BSD9I1 TaxID=2003589 RepID=UPI0016457B97|nr:ABC transporter permease [Clostridium sp. BSD9I1]